MWLVHENASANHTTEVRIPVHVLQVPRFSPAILSPPSQSLSPSPFLPYLPNPSCLSCPLSPSYSLPHLPRPSSVLKSLPLPPLTPKANSRAPHLGKNAKANKPEAARYARHPRGAARQNYDSVVLRKGCAWQCRCQGSPQHVEPCAFWYNILLRTLWVRGNSSSFSS